MKHTIIISKIFAALALLIIAASPAAATTFSYKLLGFAYDEFVVAPVQARDGLLYDAGQDESTDYGLIFNTPLGSTANVNSVYVFGDYTDGGLPIGGVVEGPDGTLYGTTGLAGAHNLGVLYSVTGLSPTSRGTETVLHDFTGGLDGATPQATLVFDTNGNLYGTARDGGQNGHGVVFKYDTVHSVFTPLYQFGQAQFCRDGSGPYSGLVQGTDGNFYGATQNGGLDCTSGLGAIYSISPSGTFTPVYWFCPASGCQEGTIPDKYGSLVEYSDGDFYGVAANYGANGAGTIFKVSSGGTLTPLYSFCAQANCPDGAYPLGGLVVGSDGNFYGTTSAYGASGYGTVFQFTPGGTLTTLYSFDFTNFDGNPYGGLVQGSDGNFYGVTSGFSEGGGYVYEIAASPALPAPVQLSFNASTVAAGSAVMLNWKVLNAFSQTLRNCYASVQGSAAGAGAWTGLQVGSYSGATKLLTGSASLTPTSAGTYTYALTCGGQESGFATLTVTGSGKATATVALSATPNPATVGQPITITATASGSGATPTGTVTFKYGTLTLTSVPLTDGSASFSPPTGNLPPGSYVLTADYAGDANYNAAVSAGYSVTLARRMPTVTLSATPNPAAVGQAITITATASGSGPAPTGTVAIKYGTLTLVNLPLSGGSAHFSPSTAGLPANTYNLTASYSGDANYSAANSTSYPITLSKANTAVSLSATPNPVTIPAACTLTATVTRSGAAGTPTGSVAFKVGTRTLATVAVNASGIASFTASTASVPPGYYPITAAYAGDGNDSQSGSGTISVYVKGYTY